METPGRVFMYCSAMFSANGWNAVEPAIVMDVLPFPQLKIIIDTKARTERTKIFLTMGFSFSVSSSQSACRSMVNIS
jgi:hypothetical protein